jgi:hypothetical protein
MKAPSPTERRNLVNGLVHTWRGRLSPEGQRALSTYDVEALEALFVAAIEVILARRGTIPGLTFLQSEAFASMQQDLAPGVLDGLRELDPRVSTDGTRTLHEQSDPTHVAQVLYGAVDLLDEQRVKIGDLQSQGGVAEQEAIRERLRGCEP